MVSSPLSSPSVRQSASYRPTSTQSVWLQFWSMRLLLKLHLFILKMFLLFLLYYTGMYRADADIVYFHRPPPSPCDDAKSTERVFMEWIRVAYANVRASRSRYVCVRVCTHHISNWMPAITVNSSLVGSMFYARGRIIVTHRIDVRINILKTAISNFPWHF